MTAIPMDTLKFAMTMRDAGMDENVAFKLAEVIKETQDEALSDLATRQDFVLVLNEIKLSETKLEAKLELVKKDIVIKLGSLIGLAVGLIAVLIKF